MPVVVVILIVLGAGIFVGRCFESAHDAHQQFSSYRARTGRSLISWLRRSVVTSLSAAALILLLYLILFRLHVS